MCKYNKNILNFRSCNPKPYAISLKLMLDLCKLCEELLHFFSYTDMI